MHFGPATLVALVLGAIAGGYLDYLVCYYKGQK